MKPALQGEQELAPAVAVNPCGHCSGALLAEQVEPAAQVVQEVAPAADHVPAAHAVGADEVEGHAEPAGQICRDGAEEGASGGSGRHWDQRRR